MTYRHINWDREQLREMRLVKKMSYPAIGRVLGCHHTSVMLKCREWGIDERPQWDEEGRRVKTIRIRRHAAPRKPIQEEASFPRESPEQAAMWRELLTADQRRRQASNQ